MSIERERFLQKHSREFSPLLNANEKEAKLGDIEAERFETKVLTWENQKNNSGKRILLEASEPIAYETVSPLLRSLEQDNRTGRITLLTDNVAGKKFGEERESLHLTEQRDEGKPLFTDIPGDVDVALVVTEPANSPDKALLYSSKSVFGNEHTKLFHLVEGLPGIGSRKLFEGENASNTDKIDMLFVGSTLAEELIRASLPELSGKIEITGSLLLASKADTFPKEESRELKRKEVLQRLQIDLESIIVFYSGFPSSDYEEVTSGQTLNQKTFSKTLEAVKKASETDSRPYALIVREHPRARGAGDSLDLPTGQLSKLVVVAADGPDFSYDEVANASDYIVCQSTSSEVSLAQYRGAMPIVSGYPDMQDRLNTEIFGEKGREVLKHSKEIIYAESERVIIDALIEYTGQRPLMPVPMNALEKIQERLLQD